jgi:hypothetical protein
MGWARFLIALLLLEAFALVPLKMLLYHAAGVRDFLALGGGWRI